MKLSPLLFSLIALLLASASGVTGYYILKSSVHETLFNVTDVIDGDTIEIDTGEKVRMLGINAPETSEHYYAEAKKMLDSLVKNKNVVLKSGSEDTDRYGRLLRYVFIDGDFVNLRMVEGGYATVYILDPEEKHYLELMKAEKTAKDGKLGVWKPSGYSGCIRITDFQYSGEERAKFHNDCNYSIKMDSWEIKDEGTHIYRFKPFILGANSDLMFFTGFGSDGADRLYWNSKTAVWNNDGDTLFLRDDRGNLVLSYSYP